MSHRTLKSVIHALAITSCLLGPVRSTAQDLASEFWPALVLIRVYSTHNEGHRTLGYGTGWLVSYDGYLISAAHVITGNKKHSWKDVVLKGEVWGKQYPIRVIEILPDFEDVALLKLEWRTEDRAEKIFDKFYLDTLPTPTQFSILGFPNPDRDKPALFTQSISQSGGAKYSSDGPVPPGLSGSPAIFVQYNIPYVIGLALGTTRDSEGREVQGEYVPAKFIKGFLDWVRKNAITQPPSPRWLPPRPTRLLFDPEIISTAVENIVKKRTVLITGPPGTGAREGAIEIGYQVREKFLSSNILYVNASSTTGEAKPFAELLERLLIQLGRDYLTKKPDEDKIDAIRNTLLESEDRLILVVDVRNENDLQAILDLRGNNPVLVTSSTSLREVSFGNVITLASLQLSACVKLFKEESGLVGSKRADTDIENICRLLGGNPRAVQVVASIVKLDKVAPKSLLEQVKKNFVALPEFAELSSAYETKYKNLTKDDQNVLKRLAVLEGESFDLRAANALIGRAIELNLKRLLRLYLIDKLPRDRFTLNRITRQLAELQLTSQERLAALQAMARYYLGEFGETSSEFEQDWDNILHTLETCKNSLPEKDGRLCLRRGVPRVSLFMKYWGMWSLHQEWVNQWYASAKVDADTRSQRAALNEMIEMALLQDRDDEAKKLVDEAMMLLNDEPDLEAVELYYARARLESRAARKSELIEKQVHLREVRDLIYQGLRISEKLNSSDRLIELTARGYRDLGTVAQDEGNFDQAWEELQKSVALVKSRNSVFQLVASYYQLGTLAFQRRLLNEAKVEFIRALDIIRRERHEEYRGSILSMLGHISLVEKNFDEADRYVSEAVVAFRQIGSPELGYAEKLLVEIRSRAKSLSQSSAG